MAGLGYKDFTAGAVLTAAQVDGYLMEQAVMNFAGTAARGSALSSVQAAGMMAHVGGGTVTVYDGSAWQQIHPTVSSPGLAYVAGTAFSSAASVSVNNCFTSTYANYRLVISGNGSANAQIQMRLRAASADNSASNYRYVGVFTLETAGPTRDSADTTTQFYVGSFTSATGLSVITIDVFAPQLTEYTAMQANSYTSLADMQWASYAGNMTVTTSYDGFTLLPGSGNMTGTVRVYGYRNS